MNPTSLITLPARLGYEVARRTIDVVVGAGRAVGLFGGSERQAGPQTPKRPKPRRRSRPKAGMDDATLARKVETEIFRIRGIAKGKIDVNAADGVVWLRGQVTRLEQMRELEERARHVLGVKEVRNLLHLPGTPPRADAPSRPSTRHK
jgi:hypothetical protein